MNTWAHGMDPIALALTAGIILIVAAFAVWLNGPLAGVPQGRWWREGVRPHLRTSGWLFPAMLVALVIGLHYGGTQYLASWAGACGKVATGAWGGYWISRNVVRADPSARATPEERNGDKLARAIVVAAAIIGVCFAV